SAQVLAIVSEPIEYKLSGIRGAIKIEFLHWLRKRNRKVDRFGKRIGRKLLLRNDDSPSVLSKQSSTAALLSFAALGKRDENCSATSHENICNRIIAGLGNGELGTRQCCRQIGNRALNNNAVHSAELLEALEFIWLGVATGEREPARRCQRGLGFGQKCRFQQLVSHSAAACRNDNVSLRSGLIVEWRTGSDDPAVSDHRLNMIGEGEGRVELYESRIAMHEDKVEVVA